MAEPIGPKFSVGPDITPGKVKEWTNFQKFGCNEIRFKLFLKIHDIFCLFSFYNVYKEKMFTFETEDER